MPEHVVVDGSNLATEGRSQPSLRQLNEAVLAFISEHPSWLVTVVVDATFGHRIDPQEVVEFDEAVNNNELVAPPAGAIGRGDAFVLSIANKVHATVLSNDSYQEFHGQYPWLFDEGRLVGGKPVPHIGWVFVNRSPVRGPLSRKSVADAKRKGGRRAASGDDTVRVGSPEANLPMPIPKAPPPRAKAKAEVAPVAAEPPRGGRGRRGRATESAAVAAPAVAPAPVAAVEPAAAAPRHQVNDLITFLSFVEHHPVGTAVSAVVDHYSSHGAYVRIGDVVGYVPLRLMGDPAPRSAREFVKIGDTVTLVVDSYVAAKRSVDLAVPHMATAPAPEPVPARSTRAAKKKAAAPAPVVEEAPKPTKRTARKRAGVAEIAPASAAAPAAPAQPTAVPARATAEKPASKKVAAKQAAAPKKAAAKKAAAPKTAASEQVAAPRKAPTKKAAAKKAPAPKKSAPDTVAPDTVAATARSGTIEAPANKRATRKRAAAPKE